MFAGQYDLTLTNGSGHTSVIGAIAPGPAAFGEGPEQFGSMTVHGGTGSVTVFGGNEGGVFQGGSAGHNLLVGGADLSGDTTTTSGYVTAPYFTFTPDPVTLIGGGDGDLLALTGTENAQGSDLPASTLVAAGGSETLTGAGSTANAFFFGGTGSELIALGGGYSVVVAGSGPETVAAGNGQAAIFAASGADLILGGSGTEYVQAGAGNATLFAGAGFEMIGVVAGQGGGSLTVSGFLPGFDKLDLQGYGGSMASIENSQVTGGSTVLTLVDGTHITLLGITSLGATSFV